MSKIEDIQELFLDWLSAVETTTYNQAKDVCSYLNEKYKLGLKYPLYHIFYPLFRIGIIDYCGRSKYAITPKIALTNGTKVLINYKIKDSIPTGFKHLYLTEGLDAIKFHGEQVMESVSSVDKIVENYPIGLIDTTFIKKRTGIIKEPASGYMRYFLEKDKGLIVKIPSMEENPDAINVALAFENIIQKKDIGYYSLKSQKLKLYRYGMPILLYRVLLVECLLSGKRPLEEKGYISFMGISQSTANQVNRILLQSLHYE